MKGLNQEEWQEFAARHNLMWSKKNCSWDSGAFLGNGRLGVMIYGAEDRSKRNTLRLVTGATDISAVIPGRQGLQGRIPLGEIEVEMAGHIYDGTRMELDLYQAEFRGQIVTTEGKIKIRSYVHSTKPVIVIEIDPDEAESETRINWYAYPEVAKVLKMADGINCNQYIPDIKSVQCDCDGVRIQTQMFSENEGCTVAYAEKQCDSRRRYFYLTILNCFGEKAKHQAAAVINAAIEEENSVLEQSHRQWWQDYYNKSFISLPDTMLEGFYLIQLYKLASAARGDSEILDNQGPWFLETPWPRAWFNMNVQMAYSPVYTSNHLDIGESLCRNLDAHTESLIRNVAPEYQADSAGLGRSASYDLRSDVVDEVGNLPWTLHNYWRQYRYSMDDGMLQGRLFPLLKRSINYYLHLLKEGEDGKLHLPAMISPEYGSFKHLMVEDTTYDLSLLRWGCMTLLQICEKLAIEDPLCETWRRTLTHLVDYHQNDSGLMIGKEVSLDFGHRHFSHLLPVFPLHLIGDTDSEKELVLRSLRHWFKREGDLRGFTFSGAASIAAAIGEGNEALGYVKTAIHLFKPNTMYTEAGPVIESPLAVAEAIQDMLLQSWGREIRVFPAVPDEWQEITFHNLRTEGAFLVSAVRAQGTVRWIRVESLAGEPCRIKAAFSGPVSLAADQQIRMWPEDDGTICLDLKQGDEVILYTGDHIPVTEIKPIAAKKHMLNYFGEYKPWRRYGIPLS